MSDQITVDDLQKAARNLRRMSEFLGERRGWILASDAESAALGVSEAARSLMAALSDMAGDPGEDVPFRHPRGLEPEGKVSSIRLSKFAEFMYQLRDWFEIHTDSELPAEAEDNVLSIHTSIRATLDAIVKLRGPSAVAAPAGEGIVSADLGPVADVDMNASLLLEESDGHALIQVFKGVTELTNETKEAVDDFLAGQHVEYNSHEMRKLHEKVLRWIRSTPESQALVVKMSGLTGKAEIYFSYRPKKTE